MGKVFVFDYDKCTGCRNCQLACKDEHVDNDWSPYAKPQPDTGQFWLQLTEKVRGQVPKVKVSYAPHLCQHCRNAPCVKSAPDVVYVREDGLVIIDPEKSSGHKELVDVCPYGKIYWNETLQIPQKCTGCAHLVDEGLPPHCVDCCPHEAIRFGDEEDFADEIAQGEFWLPERAGTDQPRVYYLNKPKRFIGGVVVDLEEEEVLIGAQVKLTNKATNEELSTLTDDFGDFWFKQIEAGEYVIQVNADGYLTRTIDADCVEEDRNVGEIDMFRAAKAA